MKYIDKENITPELESSSLLFNTNIKFSSISISSFFYFLTVRTLIYLFRVNIIHLNNFRVHLFK